MFKFKVNDTILITAGKDKGQTGTISRILRGEDKVVVEGKNLYRKHLKKQGEQAGRIVTLPRPLHLAAIALICPNCKKPTRVGFDASTTPKIRLCRKCGKPIVNQVEKKK